jgi:hypothetical protein
MIVAPPGLDSAARLFECHELTCAQAFVAQAPIERLDDGIFNWFPRKDEVALHAAAIRPVSGRA